MNHIVVISSKTVRTVFNSYNRWTDINHYSFFSRSPWIISVDRGGTDINHYRFVSRISNTIWMMMIRYFKRLQSCRTWNKWKKLGQSDLTTIIKLLIRSQLKFLLITSISIMKKCAWSQTYLSFSVENLLIPADFLAWNDSILWQASKFYQVFRSDHRLLGYYSGLI